MSTELDGRQRVAVGAQRTIAHPPERVFALLVDLTRHWPLLGADLVDAELVEGAAGSSASLLLRGPLPGLSRRIVTQVLEAREPELFRGEARAGATVAAIEWNIAVDGSPGASEVSLRAHIAPGGLRDRLLVTAAQPWLVRRCEQVLARLDAELARG